VNAYKFDPTLTVFYGQFVSAAYQMYGNDPGTPTPVPIPLPGGYQFTAWVQMKDFILADGPLLFYGLIAQDTKNTNNFILAIRGTESLTGWLDDLVSMVPVPWGDFGSVGYGFARIYQTMQVVDYVPAEDLAGKTASAPRTELTFAQQVAASVERHMSKVKPASEMEAAPSLGSAATFTVAGHSLGGALATLYVAQNAATTSAKTPTICTFASPRVGDPVFATKFNELGLTSWRVANELDVVPKLPFLGFDHVDTLYEYNSGLSVSWTLDCWHSLATYLHLLDPKQPLDQGCVPSRIAAPLSLGRDMRSANAARKPSTKTDENAAPSTGATTINITINLGRAD
jgi:hypothetical protein